MEENNRNYEYDDEQQQPAVDKSIKGYRMVICILAVILVGQIVIVTFAGQFFSVSPLSFMDWVWIGLLTMPVLLIPDVVRFVQGLK